MADSGETKTGAEDSAVPPSTQPAAAQTSARESAATEPSMPARRRRILPAAILGGVVGAAVMAAVGALVLKDRLYDPVLTGRVAQMEARLAELTPSARVKALEDQLPRIAALEQWRGQTSPVVARLDVARAELAENERKLDVQVQGLAGFPDALEAMRQRTEATLAAADTRSGERLKEFEIKIGRLDEQLAAMASQPVELATVQSALRAAEDRLTQLDARIGRDRSLTDAATGEVREQARGLNEQVNALARSIDTLRRSQPEAGKLASDLGALKVELTQLKGELEKVLAGGIGQLQGDLSAVKDTQTRLSGEITQLGERVAVLAAPKDNSATTLALAVADMGVALEAGQPLDEQLRTVAGIAKDDQVINDALQALRPAASGLPSLSELSARLDKIAGSFVVKEGPPPSDGVWQKVQEQLSGLVSLKRSGGVAYAQQVEQARRAMAADDLAGAVQALETIPAVENPALPDWLTAARQRLAAEAALQRLRGHARSLVLANR